MKRAMVNLADGKCIPCRGGEPTLTDAPTDTPSPTPTDTLVPTP